MAQPTGSHQNEPQDATTPRRPSSSESERTIVDGLLTSLESDAVASAAKKQLADELGARGLPCSGRKADLIERLFRNNASRRAIGPMDALTPNQDAVDDDRQASLEALSTDNVRLRAFFEPS
ncbi:hypothetical protein HPB49_015850 [Dermacentor silvarum]|uniref:Uncharacterized protein n=1 Tax=Dermacentor silvarum TaxID=543639 RepID=A0ACB8CFW4_DERSI|nr:hypothetical protein HPB49_015850 [Dermacentor silvarum]